MVGGLSAADVVAGLAAVGVGLLLPVLWPRGGAWIGAAFAALEELVDDPAPTSAGGPMLQDPADGAPLAPDPEPLDPRSVLDGLAAELDAARVVVWELDGPGSMLVPVIATAPAPAPIPTTGSPLAWALAENHPLRLDPPPPWALGSSAVAPIDERAVLTAENAGSDAVDLDRLVRGAAFAGAVRSMETRERAVRADEARVARAVELLRSVPGHGEPGALPEGLARTAVELVQGRGALVASWSEDRGTVLARAGDGGGPLPGTEFGIEDGDLGHAARTGAPIPREPGDRSSRPLAADAEAWERGAGAFRVALPLTGPDGEVGGLLAAWSDRPLATYGVSLLEALGPLAAVQLRQATELARFRDRASLDPLTRLPNRSALQEHLATETARFHRYRRPLALIVLDLDHFKAVNDRHGHDAGDAVLRAIGPVVAASIRDADFAARFGGEELVVVLPETMLRPALEAAERIREAVEAATIEHHGVRIPVTASLGVSACPECVDDPEALFGSADAALYEAKSRGRNRVTSAGMRVV
jgi:diguanylate cyclase (GGDEF)-like protein